MKQFFDNLRISLCRLNGGAFPGCNALGAVVHDQAGTLRAGDSSGRKSGVLLTGFMLT